MNTSSSPEDAPRSAGDAQSSPVDPALGPVVIGGGGLLGGSLALALAEAGVATRLVLRSAARQADWQRIHGQSGVSVGTDWAAALPGARLLVLAVPPEAMPALLDQALATGSFDSGLVVTDLGSVKAALEAALQPRCAAAGLEFVGSHPMAGDEQAGLEFARANLFVEARCAICPPAGTSAAAVARVSQLWQSVGGKILQLPADEHDAWVGRVSHLVHFAAGALLRTAGADPRALALAGPGLRDSTRVAAGPVPLWLEIAAGNRANLVAGLAALEANLAELRAAVEAGDQATLAQRLGQARELRRSF